MADCLTWQGLSIYSATTAFCSNALHWATDKTTRLTGLKSQKLNVQDASQDQDSDKWKRKTEIKTFKTESQDDSSLENHTTLYNYMQAEPTGLVLFTFFIHNLYSILTFVVVTHAFQWRWAVLVNVGIVLLLDNLYALSVSLQPEYKSECVPVLSSALIFWPSESTGLSRIESTAGKEC